MVYPEESEEYPPAHQFGYVLPSERTYALFKKTRSDFPLVDSKISKTVDMYDSNLRSSFGT